MAPPPSASRGPYAFAVQHDGTKDFSAARKFGSVQPVLKKGVYADDWEQRLPLVKAAIRKALCEFDQDKDYLILVGDPILIALCISTLMYLGVGCVKCLKWDRESQDYYEITLEL